MVRWVNLGLAEKYVAVICSRRVKVKIQMPSRATY